MHDFKSIIAFRETRGKHKLILDANLLILLFIGYIDPDNITAYKRLNAFERKDHDILLRILDNFESEVVITPHVLAEMSNMSKRGLGDKKEAYFNMIIEKLKQFHEEHIPLSQLIELDLSAVIRFGFSDLGVIAAAKKLNAIILSNDFKMVDLALSQNLWAINFTSIRMTVI